MSIFIIGERDRSYMLYDYKQKKAKWVSAEHLVPVRDGLNRSMLNAEILDTGEIEPKKYLTRGGGRSLARVEGNFKTIVIIDFNRGQFGYIEGQNSLKPKVKYANFSELPYYDKPSDFGNIYYKKDTGEVILDAYIIKGKKLAQPIYFKTYIKELVDKNSEAVEEDTTDESGNEVGDELTVESPEEQDIKKLVSKMVTWGKNETASIRAVNEIEIYKIMLLSQLDDSILYIPYEILRLFKYRIEHVLDRNMDMTMFVALGTLKIEGHTLVIISKFDSSSSLIRLHIVKSSRPHKDKNYDIQYIKNNYIKINLMGSYVKL